MKNRRWLSCALLLLGLICGGLAVSPDLAAEDSAPAADATETLQESAFDELLDPFDDDDWSEKEASIPTVQKEPQGDRRNFRIGGELSLKAVANIAHDRPEPGQTDWRGLSSLRARLAVEWDADLSDFLSIHASGYGFHDFAYDINGRDSYTEEVLDAYEKELELTETFVLVSPHSRLDFRFGRQIVVWGNSDNIRVTDVLNPLDFREPGLTDLEYLRLPVTMSRLDYYLGAWRLSGMAIHEIRFDKNPVLGSDYYPFEGPLPPEDKPSNGGADTEWAFSVIGTFSGWDVALYAAEYFNDRAHLEMAPSPQGPALVRRHASLKMVGAAANLALGNWLLKTEAAWQDGFHYFNTGDKTFSRFDILLGVEYSGIRETTVSVEVANRHINGFDDRLKAGPDHEQPDTFVSAIRVVREFWNDTLTATLLAMTYGATGDDGAMQRLQVEYDLRDNLELTAGVVLYQSGDLPEFENIGDNDRIFGEVAYHF